MIACKFCYSVILVSTMYVCKLSNRCSPRIALQHGASDPLLVPQHSLRAFLPFKPSASCADLQKAKKRNYSVGLRDRHRVNCLLAFIAHIMDNVCQWTVLALTAREQMPIAISSARIAPFKSLLGAGGTCVFCIGPPSARDLKQLFKSDSGLDLGL